jgi:hypothetical protein
MQFDNMPPAYYIMPKAYYVYRKPIADFGDFLQPTQERIFLKRDFNSVPNNGNKMMDRPISVNNAPTKSPNNNFFKVSTNHKKMNFRMKKILICKTIIKINRNLEQDLLKLFHF